MANRPENDHIWDSSGQINSTGSANAYVIATAEAITGYIQGMPPIRFKANFGNSGSATANVNGLGAVTLKKNGGGANLASGDIVSGGVYTLIYDGTNFQVLELNAPALVGVGLTDGDKGDITVSGSGTVWTIDAGAVPMTIGLREIADITSGDTLVASDRAKIVKPVSGTGTLAFTAAATLGANWFCYIDNADNGGDVTLNPDGSELIDGLSSWILYSRGVILVQCDGSAFRSILLAPMRKTYTADDTFTKPGCGATAFVEGWGQGGGGGRGGATNGGAGAGGGAYNCAHISMASLAATEAVTVGDTANGATVDSTPGTAGENSSFGAHITFFGGGGGSDGDGSTGGGGGGGGGTAAVGGTPAAGSSSGASGGAPGGGAGGAGGAAGASNSGFGGAGAGGGANSGTAGTSGQAGWGGGAGGGASRSGTSTAGGNSVFGGAGGGGGNGVANVGAGGTSMFGGNGGSGSTGATPGVAGSPRGGGGGGSESANAGDGGRGEVRVTIS